MGSNYLLRMQPNDSSLIVSITKNTKNSIFSWCWSVSNYVKNSLESSFEMNERRTTISLEFFCGCLHFISSLYILPVIPIQLEAAGYNTAKSIQITALASGIGCIVGSYITNLPFVIAPPSSVSIYVAVALQQNGMNQSQGDAAVILSGFALLFIGVFQPLISFATKLIPDCIQASTAIGIGLITALAGAIELKLVIPGKYAILEMGEITPALIIALLGTVLIAVAQFNKVKGAYSIGLLFGTIVWWTYASEWPRDIAEMPHFGVNVDLVLDRKVVFLLLNLMFLYILTLSGIARTMSDLANLTKSDGSIPRGNWLFIMCGVTTILSGYFSGPPILISPESAPGIKSGARTGFSMLICGILYCASVFLCPVFVRVPPAGTSPLLILVGLTLFVNVGRIRWTSPEDAVPAFFVLLLIPFTYSILSGVGAGYVLYVLIGLFTGQLQKKFKRTFYSYHRKHSTAENTASRPMWEANDSIGHSSSSSSYFSCSNPMSVPLSQVVGEDEEDEEEEEYDMGETLGVSGEDGTDGGDENEDEDSADIRDKRREGGYRYRSTVRITQPINPISSSTAAEHATIVGRPRPRMSSMDLENNIKSMQV